LWGRAESADKDSTILFEEAPFVLLVDEQRLARVQAYTAGYERELPAPVRVLRTGIGGQFTVYHAPPALAPIYGAHPFGVQLFVRVRLGVRWAVGCNRRGRAINNPPQGCRPATQSLLG
jgi:hypothetical protein